MDDGRAILEALELPQAEEPEQPELVEATSSKAPVTACRRNGRLAERSARRDVTEGVGTRLNFDLWPLRGRCASTIRLALPKRGHVIAPESLWRASSPPGSLTATRLGSVLNKIPVWPYL
ncbi:hypothetical protein LMTR13_24050 [Bradyrhizobium icense]|uniref:Uncharacterized protein n=1 Tax=Bradyrhizobium icense TaxID=1274631 RepID=A0A1B1UJ15_9BRAD|nr:hypothetical protein LMTR13_24050 [Bradyrhizobium icense]